MPQGESRKVKYSPLPRFRDQMNPQNSVKKSQPLRWAGRDGMGTPEENSESMFKWGSSRKSSEKSTFNYSINREGDPLLVTRGFF